MADPTRATKNWPDPPRLKNFWPGPITRVDSLPSPLAILVDMIDLHNILTIVQIQLCKAYTLGWNQIAQTEWKFSEVSDTQAILKFKNIEWAISIQIKLVFWQKWNLRNKILENWMLKKSYLKKSSMFFSVSSQQNKTFEKCQRDYLKNIYRLFTRGLKINFAFLMGSSWRAINLTFNIIPWSLWSTSEPNYTPSKKFQMPKNIMRLAS